MLAINPTYAFYVAYSCHTYTVAVGSLIYPMSGLASPDKTGVCFSVRTVPVGPIEPQILKFPAACHLICKKHFTTLVKHNKQKKAGVFPRLPYKKWQLYATAKRINNLIHYT